MLPPNISSLFSLSCLTDGEFVNSHAINAMMSERAWLVYANTSPITMEKHCSELSLTRKLE